MNNQTKIQLFKKNNCFVNITWIKTIIELQECLENNQNKNIYKQTKTLTEMN